MEVPGILRSLQRIFLDKEDEEPSSHEIFRKWNHLRTDGSILFFIRHYKFEFLESEERFLVSVLQASHDRGMNIDIHKSVQEHVNDVVVSVSKTFFETDRSQVASLLEWIENAYDRANIVTSE